MINPDLLLKNVSKHIELSAEESEYFISLLNYKKLKRKEFLLHSGEICRHESFVVKGCLRTYHVDEDGLEHILAFSIEDWWAEDLYSFLTQTPAQLCIDALEESEILQIEKQKLEKLYTEIPQFERFFRLSFQNAYIAQQTRIVFNLASTAESRYTAFRKKYPYSEQRFPQKQIASYLGITPEFLSMLRKKMTGKQIS